MTASRPTSPPPSAPPSSPPPSRSVPTANRGPKRKISVATASPICPCCVLNAVEGWGKTSVLAHMDTPMILSCGETGYDTLLSAGRVPAVAAAQVADWNDLMGWCGDLLDDPQGIKTLGIDTIGGAERMCHEFVCKTQFDGEWGEKGFMGFQRGFDISVPEWLKLLALLEQLKLKHGMVVMLLSHNKVAKYKNPAGPDYDRYMADVHEKTWAATRRWADMVLFGKFHEVVEVAGRNKSNPNAKGKGIGGTERVLYTEWRPAWDAKSRYGLPDEIWLLDTEGNALPPSLIWPHVMSLKNTK